MGYLTKVQVIERANQTRQYYLVCPAPLAQDTAEPAQNPGATGRDGNPYSMNMIAVQREYYRRNPEAVEGMVRAYVDGIAFMNRQRERALKIIAKYSRSPTPR